MLSTANALQCSDLLMSRASNAFQPAQLVLAHGPQTHTRKDIPGEQGVVGGGGQGHVQSLQLLSNVDSGVYAAQLLLTICLQCRSCLHAHMPQLQLKHSHSCNAVVAWR